MVKGNRDIGKHRIEAGYENRQDVFNAVRELSQSLVARHAKPRVRLEDIINYLDKKTDQENKKRAGVAIGIYGFKYRTRDNLNEAIRRQKKKTISYRTIQRCIDNDPRIKKEGWYFYIDDEARFEKRYLNPSLEGRDSYKEFRSDMFRHYYNKLNSNPSIEAEMKRLVTEIGFFMVYTLIDACRPFRDKSMDLDEREDLVRYWIQNSIPISTMLDDFLEYFRPDYIDELYDRDRVKAKKKGLSVLEMDDGSIQNTLDMLQKQYPTEYKIMAEISPEGLKRMSRFAYKDGNLI